MPLLGLDSDNGSEFLNAHLVRYCTQEELTFTRSRPYWKNDQAHVEQKNWSVVRKLVGYGRYESEAALAQLNRVYELLRIWTNFWQPSLKLVAKERDDRDGQDDEDVRRGADALPAGAGQRRPRRGAAAGPGRNVRRLPPLALRRQLAAAVEQLGRLQERPNERYAREPDENALKQAG